MPSFGKKILAAFVEVTEDEKPVTMPQESQQHSTSLAVTYNADNGAMEKFRQYFDKLFNDANIPGPDYYEFSKMTEAMIAISDEKARYSAAFAGLSVQGLDKDKLLNTAAQYINVLEQDAANFNSSVDAALKEKVQGKQQEIKAKQQRIADLSREISDLQHQVQLLQHEVKENEEKIESNTGCYKAASESMKQRIEEDIEKIRKYIVVSS